MLKTSSKNTSVDIQHLFSSSHPQALREIKIQDRDITYSIKLGNNGLEMIRAKRDDAICAQVTIADSNKTPNLKMESAYVKHYTDNGHVEFNTGFDGRVDSILMFVQNDDKTVSGALTFDLLQKSLGIWSDGRWADFQITDNGLQYVRYYTPEDIAHEKKISILPEHSYDIPIIVDGQKVTPVQIQKQPRKAQPDLPKSTQKKEVEFLSIVAQLSEPKKTELLDKWKTEALQALTAER